jgi:K+-transporting ATPase KdpF subunit
MLPIAGEPRMTVTHFIAGLIGSGLLVYLLAALLKPEWFE